MNRLMHFLLEAACPRGLGCLCCDELIDEGLLCPTCQAGLEAMRLDPEDAKSEQGISVFRYDGIASQLVVQLKENCYADAALILAEGMTPTIAEMHLTADTIVTWVTMPETRRRERGIDHGRVLCEAVAARYGFQAKQLLKRSVPYLHTQRGLNRTERLRNLAGTFVCEERINAPVLLIDDVMTTGATASACAKVLLAAGASRVQVLTATRAMLHNDD